MQVLQYLVAQGKPGIAEGVLSPVYNSHYMRAMQQVSTPPSKVAGQTVARLTSSRRLFVAGA